MVTQIDSTAVPGRDALLQVKVTNVTGKRIGRTDVTLTVGPGGLRWQPYSKLLTNRGGGTESFDCDKTDDDHLVCGNVDLDPGQWLNLRVQVGTYSWLKPCEVPRVKFRIGDHGAGDGNFVMKDEEGNPPVCSRS